MLWYGVTGVSFNPADPADVMLNTGTTAPLLSDHPRPLIATPAHHPQNHITYTDPNATALHHGQMVGNPLYVSFQLFFYFVFTDKIYAYS